MSKKSQPKQWLHWLFRVTFHRSPVQQEPLLRLLFASSVFLVLAVPAITNFPGSKLLAETAVSQNLEAASFFQQGVTRYNRQDLQGAEYAFRQAVQQDPNLGAAWNFLGNIFMQQNRLDIALQEYTEAIKANPNFSEAYYNLGLVLHRQGDFVMRKFIFSVSGSSRSDLIGFKFSGVPLGLGIIERYKYNLNLLEAKH
ncbi:tetratricopeptide repeat protein [uncultured Nostoc sp.]|uniref:tetratricopeptide repeat protein n=1 Tax=uncultured Nostoc sp. TaxID=340711 RepID=UPI0035CC78D2